VNEIKNDYEVGFALGTRDPILDNRANENGEDNPDLIFCD